MTSIDTRTEPSAEHQRHIAELHSVDIEALSGFLASVFGGDPRLWQNRFLHWWTLNPAWHPSIPRGWLVRSTAGRPIAFTANIPFAYVIDENPALCCATGSTAVDPGWRGLGLAKAIGQRFLNQTHGDLLVATGSTEVAYGLWRSLGMQSLDKLGLVSNLRIVADGATLVHALARKAGLPRFVGRAAGTCLTLLLVSSAALIRRSKSLSIAKIERFSQSDADDIATFRASKASTYSRRDISILNWLYFDTQYVRHTRAVFVARSNGRLVGYLVIKEWGEHSYYLLECRCRNADPEIARELFWAAREFARRNRAGSIIVRPYSRMIEAAIPSALTIRFGPPPMTYCYKIKNDKVKVNDWETAPSDGDLSVI